MSEISTAPLSGTPRLIALTLALLFPLVLVASELVLRYTHHRPLGAVTVAALASCLGVFLWGFVRAVGGAPSKPGSGAVASQSETEEAPAVSGVVARRESAGHEPLLIGLALVLWPLAFGWVFFG